MSEPNSNPQIVWYRDPKNGWLLHGGLQLLLTIVDLAFTYATTGNPFHIEPVWYGLVTTVGQGALSAIKNKGMHVTTADNIIPNSDVVIVDRVSSGK